ncbi:hypothetical protein [Pasteuria penetrans]|uniref:hypothetical protein n=1 Tax=Pasteuria penetrans TaxID=86005 RepID=UPI000FB4C3FC|nr:hypothetical protein [Pasteuria penetrans]
MDHIDKERSVRSFLFKNYTFFSCSLCVVLSFSFPCVSLGETSNSGGQGGSSPSVDPSVGGKRGGGVNGRVVHPVEGGQPTPPTSEGENRNQDGFFPGMRDGGSPLVPLGGPLDSGGEQGLSSLGLPEGGREDGANDAYSRREPSASEKENQNQGGLSPGIGDEGLLSQEPENRGSFPSGVEGERVPPVSLRGPLNLGEGQVLSPLGSPGIGKDVGTGGGTVLSEGELSALERKNRNQGGFPPGIGGGKDSSSQEPEKEKGGFVGGVFAKVVSPGSGYENPIRTGPSVVGNDMDRWLSDGNSGSSTEFLGGIRGYNPSGKGEAVDRTFPDRNRVKRAAPVLVGLASKAWTASVATYIGVTSAADLMDMRDQLIGSLDKTEDTDKRFSNIDREIRYARTLVEIQKEIIGRRIHDFGEFHWKVSADRHQLWKYEAVLDDSIKFKIEYPNSSFIRELTGDKSSAFWSKINGTMGILMRKNKELMREGSARYDEAFEHLFQWEWRSDDLVRRTKGLIREAEEEVERAEEGAYPWSPRYVGIGQLDGARKKLERVWGLSKLASKFQWEIQRSLQNLNHPLMRWHLEKEDLMGLKKMLVTRGRRLWSEIIHPHRESDGDRGTEDFDSFEREVREDEERVWRRGGGAFDDHGSGEWKRWLVTQPPWMARRAPLFGNGDFEFDWDRMRTFQLRDWYVSSERQLIEWRSEWIRIYQNSSWVDIPKDLRDSLGNMMWKIHEGYAGVKGLGGLMAEDERRRVDDLIMESEKLKARLIAAEPRLVQADVHGYDNDSNNDTLGVLSLQPPRGVWM